MAGLSRLDNIKFSFGDFNNNGKVSNKEVKKIINYTKKPTTSNSKEYNQKFIKKADVNGDGIVNKEDLNYYKNENKTQLNLADVNGDGKTDEKDIKYIKHYIENKKYYDSMPDNANEYNVEFKTKADVNGDGIVDYKDISFLTTKNYYQATKFINEKQKKAFNEEIDKQMELRNKIGYTVSKKTEDEAGGYSSGAFNGMVLTPDEEKVIVKKYGSLDKAYKAIGNNIAAMKYAISEIDKNMKLLPYQEIQDSKHYKKMDTKLISDNYYNMLKKDFGSNNEKNKQVTPNSETDTFTLLTKKYPSVNVFQTKEKAQRFYKYMSYMTPQEREMCGYIIKFKGVEQAEKYLDIMKDDINKRVALKKALMFYNTLLTKGDKLTPDQVKRLLYDNLGQENAEKIIKKAGTNPANIRKCINQGVKDGTLSFFEGFENIFNNDTTPTESDYRKGFIAQLISGEGLVDEHGNKLSGSKLLNLSYKAGSGAGYMAPVILASTLTALATSPAGGAGGGVVLAGMTSEQLAEKVGLSLMFTSSFGNNKHEALCNGYSMTSAVVYALASSGSEVLLEKYMGSLPYLGKTSRSFAKSALMEGSEEFIQSYVNKGITSIMEDKPINLDEANAEAQESLLLGAVLGGMFSLDKLDHDITVISDGKKYLVSRSKVMSYLKQYKKANNLDGKGAKMVPFSDYINDSSGKTDYPHLGKRWIATRIQYFYRGNVEEAFTDIIYNDIKTNGTSDPARLSSLFGDLYSFMMQSGSNYSKWDAMNFIYNCTQKAHERLGMQNHKINFNGKTVDMYYLKGSQYYSSYKTDIPTIVNYFSDLPPFLQSMVNKIYFYDSVNPEDHAWNEEFKYGAFHSYASAEPTDGTIQFFAGNNANGDTLRHEIGHIYDKKYAKQWGIKDEKISDSKLWKDAMKNDKEYSGMDSVSEYGENSSQEDFAEAFMKYCNDPNSLNNFPYRKRLFDQILKNQLSRGY